MRRLIFIVLISFFSASFAENAKPSHQKTLAPADARFEFVQSLLAARGTFRLDKFTGVVHQIVKNKDDDTTWQEIIRLHHVLDKQTPNKVNYQLFTSGLAMQFTFLINVNTGATWQLVETPQKDLVWSPVI